MLASMFIEEGSILFWTKATALKIFFISLYSNVRLSILIQIVLVNLRLSNILFTFSFGSLEYLRKPIAWPRSIWFFFYGSSTWSFALKNLGLKFIIQLLLLREFDSRVISKALSKKIFFHEFNKNYVIW